MIVIASSGYFPWTLEFIEGETFAQMIERFKTEFSLHFETGYTLQDTTVGRVIDPSETVIDERRYQLTAWVVRALTT